KMIVRGGYENINQTTFNTGGRYDPSTNSWTATSTTGAPDARQVHTAVWTGSQMIVWGGDGCNLGFGCYLNTGGRYNPSTDSWTATTTTSVPDPRYSHTAVWTGSQMIVWGGQSNIGYFNTGGRYCAQSGPTPTATPTATHTPTPTPTPTSTPGGTPAPPIANAAMSIASNSFTANWS